jgi:hypothetical protein
MPSASLKTRIARLETAQAASSDDAYWQWVMANVDTHVDMFGKALRNEISMSEWTQWHNANPWPDRGRPLTDQEQREAEEAREEFHEKIKKTRERLINGFERGLLDNPERPKRGSDALNNTSHEDRKRSDKPAEQPATGRTSPRHGPSDSSGEPFSGCGDGLR